MNPLKDLANRIRACGIVDQRRLMQRVGALRSRPEGPERAQALARLISELGAAEERVRRRAALVPKPRYDDALPVCRRRAEIAEAIGRHQVVVLCGETGSGKTTQLPKICLEAGRGVRGMIGHTQPRRIAAVSVARRVAEELELPLGRGVGYKIRFGDKTSSDDLIKVMTDGVLLAETQGDRRLERYDTIIIDEAHERSLNIDFLLGYLRTLLPVRPELKVIVTSATIDPERFSRHFGNAPIISVEGRTYPVEERYRPLREEDADERDGGMETALLDAVDECAREGEGDILVFLSGEREIREAAESLRKHHVPGAPRTAVLPLFARLTAEEQHKVFEPHPGRRIVLATNIAETSLTVPGIRFVVDTGLARVSRYSPRTKVQRLEVEAIARASADQRKGRCGRLGPGICIRLYDEQDYLSRPRFADPEIVRTNLAAVILQMKALRLGDVERFPFIDAPDPRLVKDGHDTLTELGAIDAKGELTKIGRELARLPIDPRVGRIILAASEEGCLEEGLVIAASLSVQDPRERPLDAQDLADAAHAGFRDDTSDFLSILKLWAFWREQKKHLSGSKLRKMCKTNFLSFVKMREWDEVHHQLTELVHGMGYKGNIKPAGAEAVHRAVLSGLLSSVGLKGEQGEFSGPRGLKFRIFPGSTLFKKSPRWIVSAELVRTSQLYARVVAPIDPTWIERLGGDLVKRSQSDPHFDERQGKVVALEKGSFLGLELYKGRRVNFGKIKPSEARQIFIHQALVEEALQSDALFYRHNKALVAEIRELEKRSRRSDLLADQLLRYEFYDKRLGAEVCDAESLFRWLKRATKAEVAALEMTREDILVPDTTPVDDQQYPTALRVGETVLPLEYRHEPGHRFDGVTARLPVEALARGNDEHFGWLVPGLLQEKVATLLRSLPKDVRRVLPHPTQLVASCVAALKPGAGALEDQVLEFLRKSTGLAIAPEVVRGVDLPQHLTMHFKVVGADGGTLAEGSDLSKLRRDLAKQVREALLHSHPRWRRDGVTRWDFGDLPERVEIVRDGMTLVAFPAVIDEGRSVSLRLLESRDSADAETRRGVRKLATLEAGEAYGRATRFLPAIDRAAVTFASLGDPKTLRPAALELIAERAFLSGGPAPRTEAEFRSMVDRGMQSLGRAIEEVSDLLVSICASAHDVKLRLVGNPAPAWAQAYAEARQQLLDLTAEGFLSTTAWIWLQHYPRYLAALSNRLSKLAAGGHVRDARLAAEVAPFAQRYRVRREEHARVGMRDPNLETYRWMVEEFRVQVFAQELRTSVPVSAKRLEEQWNKVAKV